MKKIMFIIFILINLIIIGCIYKANFLNTTLRGDGWGYYIYNPILLIDKDNDLNFRENAPLYYKNMPQKDGKILNKYPIGTATLQLPFIYPIHKYVESHIPIYADGWSQYYQKGVFIATNFYYILGILFTFFILQRFVNWKYALATCVLLTYGTNLFYYLTACFGYSHIYSFFAISLFVYLTLKMHERQLINCKEYQFFLLGIVLGLIFDIRNINIIVALFFIIMEYKNFTKVLNKLPYTIIGFFLAIFPQLLCWKLTYGSWLVRSYGANEYFQWLKPNIVGVLFSSNNSLFTYCPILLFSFIGLFFIQKKADLFFPIVITLIIHLYIMASWKEWWMGDSFSQRTFVDFYCLYGILLGIGIQTIIKKLNKYPRFYFILIISFFCVLTMYYTFCFGFHYLPPQGATWENLKNVLMFKYL